jgi:ribosomal protein S18 acetylase RimI-like enzyme
MENITIRKALTEDAYLIIDFNVRMAFETEGLELSKEKITNGVINLMNNPGLGFYIVVECNGKIAGSLMVTTEWSDWRNGLFWWIQSVYVLPEFRRMGIYRAMYEHVKELAQGRPEICGYRLYVERNNKIAQTTYEKLGMEETHYLLYEEIKK